MTSAAKPASWKTSAIGPDLRSALIAMVRKRVPESEVEDIVQQALAEAIESPHAPEDSESLRRWIFGVAKNKVVDYHRRAGRESFDMPDVAGEAAPHVEADLLRWAERNLPEGSENQKTLDWMIREGEGEKLESIAESEKLPPPRVRQRVSRLRRHFKENWQREVALLAALGVIVSAILVYVLRPRHEPDVITHDVVDPRAEPMRRAALEKCAANDWQNCLDGLDTAKRLDPAGDDSPEIQKARQAAGDALKTAPPPSPSDSATAPPLDVTPPPTPAPTGSTTMIQKMRKPAPSPKTAKPTGTDDFLFDSKSSPFPSKPTSNNSSSDFPQQAAPQQTAASPSKEEPSKAAATKGGNKKKAAPMKSDFGTGSSF